MTAIPMHGPGWRVACSDPYGRDRSVTVIVEDDDVLVVPPPGQAAVLSGAELVRLSLALGAAAETTTALSKPRS